MRFSLWFHSMCGRTMRRGIDEVECIGRDELCQAAVFSLTNLFLFLPRFQEWQNHENRTSALSLCGPQMRRCWLKKHPAVGEIVLVVSFVFFQQYC